MTFALLLLAATATFLSSPVTAASKPMRPPNGTYEYSMAVDGSLSFKSTIVVSDDGLNFDISETTKLPNGAMATTRSTWSSTTLLPQSFEVRQGKIHLVARITPEALTFPGKRVSFPRIAGTDYVLPSVGLITTTLSYPYVVSAHPGESFTVAEIQNGQTVIVRPDNTSPPPSSPSTIADNAITVIKDEEHGNSPDKARLVIWLNAKTGIMDSVQEVPHGAKITLLSFTPR
jgi:hypothetical protein